MLWNSVALKKIFFDSLPLTGCDASQNCSIFICLINLFTIYALTLAMRGQHMYWIAHHRHRYCNFLGNFNKWWKKPHLNIYPSLSKQEIVRILFVCDPSLDIYCRRHYSKPLQYLMMQYLMHRYSWIYLLCKNHLQSCMRSPINTLATAFTPVPPPIAVHYTVIIIPKCDILDTETTRT